MTLDLRDRQRGIEHGLRTEPEFHLDSMLHDLDPVLSLRRIPERDPAFTPEKPLGVYEEGTKDAMTPWAFTLHEVSVTNPAAVIARAAAGDMTKLSPKEKMQLLMKSQHADRLKRDKDAEERAEAMNDEALFLAKSGNGVIRHRINGEMKLLGDEIRAPRTFIV